MRIRHAREPQRDQTEGKNRVHGPGVLPGPSTSVLKRQGKIAVEQGSYDYQENPDPKIHPGLTVSSVPAIGARWETFHGIMEPKVVNL